MSAVEAVVEAAEAVDEVVEAVEMIGNLNGTTRKQQIIVLVAVGLGAAVVSGAASHLITKHVLTTKFERLMEEELDKTREFYANRQTVTIDDQIDVPDPIELLRATKASKEAHPSNGKTDYKAISDNNEFVAEGPPDPALLNVTENGPIVAVKKNVFLDAETEAEWLAANQANQDANLPYIISKVDFLENEDEWPSLSFSYFEADGVLADETEEMLEDIEAVVGQKNLERMGWLSQDPNTIYIRVPEHETYIEVTRSTGSYAAEVHGFQHGDDTFEPRRKGGRVRFGDD